jgi:transcription initiation factor TFIID subunit TAF12
LRSDGHASRVKILEGEMKALKEKLSLLLNKGNDDDALIDALKRELIATKQQQQQQQQHQGSSARVTSAGREKPSLSAGGAGSAQLTSSLKSDLAKVLCAHFRLVSVPSIL